MEYYGIWAVRSGASVMGSAEAWSKRYGVLEVFTSKEDAQRQAEQYNRDSASANVRYSVREMEPELAVTALRDRAKLAPIVDEKKIYLHTVDYARKHDELALYRESNRLNRECAADIDLGINARRESNYLPPELAGTLIAQYGVERVRQVLANTVQQKDWDGRFSHDNKDWANTFPRLASSRDGVADAHPVFVDGFIDNIRRLTAEQERQAVQAVNPLAAAEMSTEQNYNMIDGLHNNLPTPKSDLTDGQTYEEIKELAPETLPTEERPSTQCRKFEDVDIIASLAAVVERNNINYKTDFEYDKEAFIRAAESPDPINRTFLWLSRQSGTECCFERNAFISNTEAHTHWTYYEGQSTEIKAFAVEIAGMIDGKVMGNLFALDYPQSVQQVKRTAMEPESVLLTFKDGEQKRFSYEEYNGHFQRIQNTHGRVTDVRHEVKDESVLLSLLKQQHDTRQRFPARSFAAYIKKLDAPARPEEKPSVTEKLKAAKQAVKPPISGKPSPSKSEPVL